MFSGSMRPIFYLMILLATLSGCSKCKSSSPPPSNDSEAAFDSMVPGDESTEFTDEDGLPANIPDTPMDENSEPEADDGL